MTLLRAVIFDLDGTLIDSVPDITDALNRALAVEARPPLEETAVTRLVGGGARELIAKALGGQAPAPVIERVLAGFLDAYAAQPARATRLYPGLHALLDHLKAQEMQLGLCTNKPAPLTAAILKALDLEGYFASVAAAQPGRPLKPDPEALRICLRDLGVASHEAVMVGDSRADAAVGVAAGVPVILVAHGYEVQPLDRLGAAAVVPDLGGVAQALAALSQSGIAPGRSKS